MTKIINLLILLSTFFFSTQLKGQVTIGSNNTPNKGTLLDIKEFEDEESRQGGGNCK